MTAIPPRLPRDTKALQDMAQDSGQYAKYMTYRTNSSDYGAHTLPSAGSQAGISPRAQCLHNRRTIQEMTARFTTDHSWSQLGGTVPRKHTTITLPPNAKPGAKMNVELPGEDGLWQKVEFTVPEFGKPYMNVRVYY